jgi:4-amino-4-deoxy-L-arabinose transferase-like glycosyltransferase
LLARPLFSGIAVLALTLLVQLLGFYRLGTKSAWLDESVSISYARDNLGSLWHVVSGDDPNMGIYYAALRLWVAVFGESEAAARSLSVLFAMLAVPALYLMGARLFGRAAGLAAALLLAVNEFFIAYAQEARSYSLVLLLVVLSSYFFVVQLERPSSWTWAGYVVASSAAVYAHYFAAYVLVAQLVTLVVARRRAAFARPWLTAVAAIMLVCAPEAVAAYQRGTDGIAWIPPPNAHGLVHVPLALAGGSRTVLVLYFLAGCYAAALAARAPDRWRFGFAAAWFAVPVLVSFVVSFARPMFLDYYLIVSLPALVLVAAAGITRLPTVAAAALLLVLCSLSGLRLANWYRSPAREDWRDAAQYVIANRRAGDRVAYYPSYASVPFEYYLRREDVRALPHLDPSDRLFSMEGIRRIWFVLRGNDAQANSADVRRIEQAFAPKGPPAPVLRLGRIEIELYVLRPPAG